MGSRLSSLHLFLSFLLLALQLASSNNVVDASSIGRSLLQQKQSCSLDLENMNYTVITSQCKGPRYTRHGCCDPLKQMLCPVRDVMNEANNNCAETFFSYANLYGKYPPGLFASLCNEIKEGLDCAAVDKQLQQQQQQSSAAMHRPPSLLLLLILILLI